VILGLVAGCGSSSPESAPPTGGVTIAQTPATSDPGSVAATVDATSVSSTATTTFVPATTPPVSNERAKLPGAIAACGRLGSAATVVSLAAEGQKSPSVVPDAGGDGFTCTMTWKEPDASSLTAHLLVSSKAKMFTELQDVGYVCDPTPVTVAGWPSAAHCSAADSDGLHSLIRLDNGTEAISLSFWGASNRGVDGQTLIDALLIVLGPPGEVIVGAPPASSSSIAPTPGDDAANGPLPSKVWDGKYSTEPGSGPLRIGDMGQRVSALQRALGLRGLLDPPYDGYFGPDTEAALVKFQQDEDLPANGIATDLVLQALE
jgi:Putative peptidoglycan binding domain